MCWAFGAFEFRSQGGVVVHGSGDCASAFPTTTNSNRLDGIYRPDYPVGSLSVESLLWLDGVRVGLLPLPTGIPCDWSLLRRARGTVITRSAEGIMGKKTVPEDEKDKARGRKESGIQRRSCQRSRKEKWRSVVERTTPWTAALEELKVSTIAPLQTLMFLLAPPSEVTGRDVRLLTPHRYPVAEKSSNKSQSYGSQISFQPSSPGHSSASYPASVPPQPFHRR